MVLKAPPNRQVDHTVGANLIPGKLLNILSHHWKKPQHSLPGQMLRISSTSIRGQRMTRSVKASQTLVERKHHPNSTIISIPQSWNNNHGTRQTNFIHQPQSQKKQMKISAVKGRQR